MTDRPCLLCHRSLHPTDTRTCVACLGHVRRQLRDLARLHALLPAFLAHYDSPSLGNIGGHSSDPALPGGDALAMLGPGASGGHGQVDDPPAVPFEMHNWCVTWAEQRPGDEPPRTQLVDVTVDWLSVRAGWAADNSADFDYFEADITRIIARLEQVTHSGDRPEKGPPCPYCRTADLQRDFTDHGLPDDWRCPACRRDFNYAQYVLALRAEVERVAG